MPAPFVVGIYRGPDLPFLHFWGDDCIEQTCVWLQAVGQEYLIYAHNGGKFDYLYFLPEIGGNLRIVNGRIVSAKLFQHEIRDSYAIMPFPLRDYKKDEIDYAVMERRRRGPNKKKILDYLQGDCVYLYDLVTTFHAEFGQTKLTIGSTAMGYIKELHPFERTSLAFDKIFRPQFFYGGRVQCFDKTGIIEGICNIYDVNSMYPAMMCNREHPQDIDYHVGQEITDATCFVVVKGKNAGAFPARDQKRAGGLTFERTSGEFTVTRTEYDAGIGTGTFEPQRIIRTYDFFGRSSFSCFVHKFFDARKKAREAGDDIRTLLFKFVLNSGYGKFAQNPANFYDWSLETIANRPKDECQHCKGSGACGNRWCLKCSVLTDYQPSTGVCAFCGGDGNRWHLHEYDTNNPAGPMLWKARTFQQSYYNVATGASITGAARATLLMGLAQSDRPLYCDTDSIITMGEFRGDVGKELGQWKHEGTGCLSAIAGKKLYAIFTDRPPELSDEDRRKYPWMLAPIRWKRKRYWCIKKAHKGLKLSPEEIMHIANGWTVEKANDAPSFGLYRPPMFIKRRARMTV